MGSVSALAAVVVTGAVLAGTPATSYRVLVSTDLGGDPDDVQSLYRLVHYSDVLRTEGIVSSPGPGARHSAKLIREWIARIEVDRMRTKGHRELMSEAQLLALVKQGSADAGPPSPQRRTEGSAWIVECASAAGDSRPLWVLVWGSATDVAQALHDDPSIAARIRLYTIGANNTRHDPLARQYIFDGLATKWPDLFWIENGDLPNGSRDTFRGVYLGGDQAGEWSWTEFVRQSVRPYAPSGVAFPLAGPERAGLKEGDSPSMLYLLSEAVGKLGNVEDPTGESWGGRFRHFDRARYPNYYVDLDDKAEAQASVSKWRVAFLSDWKKRWAWYGAPKGASQ